MTATTRHFDPTALASTLCISFELGEGMWKLSFTSGFGEKVVRRGVRARDREAVVGAIEAMTERLGLAGGCRVVSCYEAGRHRGPAGSALSARIPRSRAPAGLRLPTR